MMFLSTRFHLIFVVMLFCILLPACGPSPEELTATSAAETAAAATNTPTITPTPTTTPTPTPIPYDLSILVLGVDEAPVVGASIILAKEGEEWDKQISDDVGLVFWNDLPGETVNITISSQGYFSAEVSETINRGDNQLTVNVEIDPSGILPTSACFPGEKLLYIEDFQDGEAQGWQSIELRTQGWDIVPDTDFPDDLVLFKPANSDGWAGLQDLNFDNTVWRLEFKPIGRPIFWFNVPWNSEYEIDETTVEWSAYQMFFHPPDIRSFRAQPPISTVFLFDVVWTMESNVWHQLEISRYQDTYEIWIDGRRYLKYVDPKPLPGGTIHFGVGLGQPTDPNALIFYDDFVICELTEPFVPVPTAEP